MIRTQILAHEERVRSRDIAADDAIALATSEPHQRLEARAEEVGAAAGVVRLVGNGERHRRPQSRIVFDHDHARLDHLDRLPHPVIVEVDVDAEQIDLSVEVAASDQRIDILRRHDALQQRKPFVFEKRIEA